MSGWDRRRSGDQDNPLVPSHSRMRGFDRDLIRGGHYGQRPCEPHSKAEHMAAPTKAANVKKVLANSEPSTHGTKRTSLAAPHMSAFGGERAWLLHRKMFANDPKRTSCQRISRPAHHVAICYFFDL